MRRLPFLFFGWVFVLSVPFWWLGMGAGGFLPEAIPIRLPFAAWMFICPMLAALLLVYRESGLPGIRQLMKRAFDYSRIREKFWYLPALGLMPACVILAYLLKKCMGAALPDLLEPDWLLPVSFAMFFVGAIGEELGWMGYAMDALQERWGALRASLLLGVVWAIWHVIPFRQAGNSWSWILWQCLFTVSSRVLIAWFYNNTGKSVFAAGLYHMMINVSSVVLPNYGIVYDPFLVGLLITLLAVLVACLWRAEALGHFRCLNLETKNV